MPVLADDSSSDLRVDAATAAGMNQSATSPASPNPYAQMSLDELMSVQVTSVSGLSQSWFSTPAAMYVITANDIQQVGARSLPEALRLAPGVQVGRVHARSYAISIRGDTNLLANKLQVLIDGRSIYEPMFSGIQWDQEDMILDDLDRIEVIRGPGATLWGANAVNGVININTKSTQDTQGVYLNAGVGTEERYFGAVRYGAAINNDTWFKVWAKYINRDNSLNPATDRPWNDAWDAVYGGFRMDHEGADNTQIMIEGGGFYSDNINEHIRRPDPATPLSYLYVDDRQSMHGGHVLARIDRDLQSSNGWQFQGYADYVSRDDMVNLGQTRWTVDMDFRHHFQMNDQNDILWGAGWRFTHTKLDANGVYDMDPSAKNLNLFSAFAQDTVTLLPDRLFAMIGSKFEHNDFTGFEYQPSARLWWTPNDHQTLWGAVSRSVRTPSVYEVSLIQNVIYFDAGGGPPLVPITFHGNENLKSEKLYAFELGYRHKLDNVTVDVTGFMNRYSDYITITADNTTLANLSSAESYGAEVSAEWQVNPSWRLTGTYSYLRWFIHDNPTDLYDPETETPVHQFTLRSHYALNKQWDVNAALYFAGERAVTQSPPGDYARLDLGLTWRPAPNLEISVWGQNLLDSGHVEYLDSRFNRLPIDIQRSVYLSMTYRF